MNATTKPQDIYIMKKIKLIELLNAFSKITFIMAVTLFLSAFLSGCTQSVSVNYYNPNWLPDGRIIAVKESVGSVQELVNPAKVTFVNAFLVAMDIDGKNEKALFECSALMVPIPSPDGTKIASSIFIRDLTGKLLETIPSKDGTRSMDIVDWSPDSKKVLCAAYESNETPKYIYTYDLTTKVLKYLAEGYEPAWNNEVGIVYLNNGICTVDEVGLTKNILNQHIHDPKIVNNGQSILGLKGRYKFFDIKTKTLTKEVHLEKDQPVLGFHLSPDGKYIVSTDDHGVGVYLTEVETGLGRFVVTGSTYKK